MNVRYVVGDLVKGTVRFRVEELVTKSVSDAIEEEICVMIVRKGSVPRFCSCHNGKGAGRQSRDE
jgi:hypothetical protein